jgi:hypothetical protein
MMNYEWTLLNRGVHDTWRKARTEKSAFRAAMKVARRWFPEATNKFYTRSWTDPEYGSIVDFGHYTVFIAIRKVENEEHK